jgi:5-hydroxyisourate hydrolase-like protein (transthyretin family)
MTRRILAVAFLVAAGVLVSVDRVAACVCAILPTCASVASADAIFIGQVIDVRRTSAIAPGFPGPRDGSYDRVRVRVQETFIGGVSGELDVFPVNTLADCWARFELGGTYLVISEMDATSGRLLVSPCGGARALSDVPDDDLAYFRSLPTLRAETGVIRGTARLYEYVGPERVETTSPLAGVVVVGRSANHAVQAITDTNGNYRIDAPPGRYTFTAEVPDGLYVRGPGTTWAVDLLDPRGCVEPGIPVFVNGRIAGRVVDAAGAPVPRMTVVALSDPRGDQYANATTNATDADGRFEIGGLDPGEHVLVLDTIWSPALTLPRGGRIDLGTLALPRGTRIVSISGRVRRADGRPVIATSVSVFESVGTSWRRLHAAVTDSAGRFQRNVVAGRRYMLLVEIMPASATVPPFDATEDHPPFDIVLEPSP